MYGFLALVPQASKTPLGQQKHFGTPLIITLPYEFIGFGAMEVTKPYKFIGFGAMEPHPTLFDLCPAGPALISDLFRAAK